MRKAKRTSPKLPEAIKQEHELYLLEIMAELLAQISVSKYDMEKIDKKTATEHEIN